MLELQNNMLHSNTVWRAENQRREALSRQRRHVRRNWSFFRRNKKAVETEPTRRERPTLRPSVAAE